MLSQRAIVQKGSTFLVCLMRGLLDANTILDHGALTTIKDKDAIVMKQTLGNSH